MVTIVAEVDEKSAKENKKSAKLDMTVTASLQIQMKQDDMNFNIREEELRELLLNVTDKNGRPMEGLQWYVSATTHDSGIAIVEFPDKQPVRNEDGSYTLSVRGFSRGESTITVTCRYSYGNETYAQQTVTLVAATKPADKLGFGYVAQGNSTFEQIKLSNQNPNSQYVGQPTADGPEIEGLYLYLVNCEYSKWEDFELASGQVTVDGVSYPVENGAFTIEGTEYALTLGDIEIQGSYQIRRVQIQPELKKSASITLVLTKDGVSYQLDAAYIHYVKLTLLDCSGNKIGEYILPYGSSYTPTEEEKKYGDWDIPERIEMDTTIQATKPEDTPEPEPSEPEKGMKPNAGEETA